MGFFWTIVTLVIALGLAWRYLGSYMAAVFEGRVHFLAWAERPVLPGCSAPAPSTSRPGSATPSSLIIFSAVSIAFALPVIEDPRVAAAQPAAPRSGNACTQLQHGRFVH